MDGITILSMGEYVETIGGGACSIASVLLLIFGILTFLLGTIIFFSSKECLSFCAGIFILFIGGAMFAAAVQEYKNNGPTINIPQYKVIISDSVPYNEFAERYNVLEVEGKIFTVIDKTEYEAAKAELEGS